MIIEIILAVIAIELLVLIIAISDTRDYIVLHINGLDARLITIIDFIVEKKNKRKG